MRKTFQIIWLWLILIMTTFPASFLSADSLEATIKNFKAGSELVEPQHNGAYIYPPVYAFDGNKDTAWVEGEIGIGSNIKLGILFSEKIVFDEIQIINGFAKNERLYMNNNRIKKIKISFTTASDGPPRGHVEHWEENIFELKDRKMEWQSLKFKKTMMLPPTYNGDPGPSNQNNYVYFQINEVYPGKYNDSCISDIRFLYKGQVIKFQNISDFVKKQSERSLKMAFEAKNSDADYFKHLYTQNGAGFFESETGLTYYFLGSVFRIYKRNSDGFEKGNYSIKGNYIFIRESSASYSYFQIPIKLHFKPAGPEAIFINGNKCKRIDRTWTDEWEGWRMDE